MCPICSKSLVGKQKYCSGACRVKASRSVTPTVTKEVTSVTKTTKNVTLPTNVTPSMTKTVTAKLERIEGYEDFYINPGCSHIEGIDTCLKSYCPNYRGVKYYEKFPKKLAS